MNGNGIKHLWTKHIIFTIVDIQIGLFTNDSKVYIRRNIYIP